MKSTLKYRSSVKYFSKNMKRRVDFKVKISKNVSRQIGK